MLMEPALRARLLKLFEIYQADAGIAFTTISDQFAGDARFHDNLLNGSATFTVQRYDRLIARFSACWPPELPWPPEIERVNLDELQPRRRKRRAKVAG